ncbi:AraC family transcriptional regulator [Leptolyngbya sp. 'hensonii']|uniref:AraC family transcriptional regulator n=1 Tax=Leptolyngbya sp. 'hensonii' TaxID=1922337 RepID=UPI00094FABA3|nr:AraC family transcriptional regulator [Leptolyngbya sp. 'hensonii']OLP15397.1 AraC family transcriptional regulator [Leptolyngbya sp. 'hensonii']
MQNSVSVKLVQAILEAAAHCGLNADDILAALKLAPSCLEDVDGRISHEQFCALWQAITQRTDKSALALSPCGCIGLQMAVAAKPKTWDVLGYAMHSSANLGEAFERLVRYSRLRHTGAEFTFEVQGDVARITMAIPSTALPPNDAMGEWVGANFVLLSRQLTGLDLVPLQMGFQHSKPEDLSAYHHLFRSPLAFDQPVNEMRLDAAVIQRPLAQADPGLSSILDRHAEELLARLPQSESLLDSVNRLLSEGLRGGNPSLTAIAQQLGYAPRTLQRKLQEVGTSYHTLLDEMRRELSIYYLREAQIAVSEVAFLLGFSETSAFHRAFRRWMGVSPGEFRRSA